ncbi:hypothetical protein [Bacillus mycoides]|uniref:hypothetical protein n=1 Tax=Bacillus mycoides TaxID=1405 RepID=UPI003D65B0E7
MRLFEKIGSFFKKESIRLQILEVQINDLQREVESLNHSVYVLSKKIDTKADKVDVHQMIGQSEIIKKINDSDSVEMTSKVGISLDGKIIAESVVEQTTDGYKMSSTNINGVRTNETI